MFFSFFAILSVPYRYLLSGMATFLLEITCNARGKIGGRTPILPRAFQVISTNFHPFQIADIDRVRSKSSHGQFLVIFNKKVPFQLADTIGYANLLSVCKEICCKFQNPTVTPNQLYHFLLFLPCPHLADLRTLSIPANWNRTFLLTITKNCPWEDFERTLSISAIWNAYFLLEITCNARGN